MQKRNWLILLVWLCCVGLDQVTEHPAGPDGEALRESFLGALFGALSLGSGIAGSIAANKRRKQAERELAKRKKELQQWHDAEIGTNFLDRADSRAALRRAAEFNQEAQKAANTDALKQGMTDEAKVAQAAKLNRNYADVVSQIAAAGARHKDQVEQEFRNETRNLDNLKIQNMMDSSGTDNLVQGITGAAAGLGTALATSVPKSTMSGAHATSIPTKLQSMAANAVDVPAWANRYKI